MSKSLRESLLTKRVELFGAVLLTAAGLVSASVLRAQTQGQTRAQVSLPEGAGKEVVQNSCAACHSLTTVANAGHTREEWDSVLHMMINAGAKVPTEQVAGVLDYLAKNFPEKPAPPAVVIPGPVGVSIKEWKVPTPGSRPHDPAVAPDGSVWYTGEESAGASFLRLNGSVWTTDKDGLVMDLLAAEITARTGTDPGEHFRELTAEFGMPFYTRIDAAATPEQKEKLLRLSPEDVKESELAGEPILHKLIRAPGNNALVGGLKVVTPSGWFAARPSGTENIYKIYAESFKDQRHLDALVSEAKRIVDSTLL